MERPPIKKTVLFTVAMDAAPRASGVGLVVISDHVSVSRSIHQVSFNDCWSPENPPSKTTEVWGCQGDVRSRFRPRQDAGSGRWGR